MTEDGVISIADVVRFQAQEQPDAVVFIYEDDEMTYARLDEGSNRAAQALASKGVGKGDRIAYMGKNSHLYFEILLNLPNLANYPPSLSPINLKIIKVFHEIHNIVCSTFLNHDGSLFIIYKIIMYKKTINLYHIL